MKLIEYFENCNQELVDALKREYENFVTFEEDKNFLKVGHIYHSDANGIDYMIYKKIPFLEKNSNVDAPDIIYCVLPLGIGYHYDDYESYSWKTEQDLYKLMLTDVTDTIDNPEKIKCQKVMEQDIKNFWEFYWSEDHTKIFKVTSSYWSFGNVKHDVDGKLVEKRRHICKTYIQVMYLTEDRTKVYCVSDYSCIRLAATEDCWCIDNHLVGPYGYNGQFYGRFSKKDACKEIFGVDSMSKLEKVYPSNIELKSVFNPFPYSGIKIQK